MKNAEFRNKNENIPSLVTRHPSLYADAMSRKGKRVAEIAGEFSGGRLDRHYTGYFELFNRQEFFEAHEVLEHIWLKDKHGANGNFYKGLIQLAGAFVHLQKNRLRPAAALFKLAQANFGKYPREYEELDLKMAGSLIEKWLADLEAANFEKNPLLKNSAPKLNLDL